MRVRGRGFTLVEALIAATIFFASIVVIGEAYRTSLAASRKAQATAALLAPVPILMSQVANRLREDQTEQWEQRGEMLGIAYKASAKLARKIAPPTRIDAESGTMMSFPARFKIFDISLEFSKDGQSRRIRYEELIWAPLDPAP